MRSKTSQTIPPMVWQVLTQIEQNLEPVPTPDFPQVMVNRAVLFLASRRLVNLTDPPSLTRTGRLLARAASTPDR